MALCLLILSQLLPSCAQSQTCESQLAPREAPPFAALQIPVAAAPKISSHPLLIGASPGTTGTMSLYYALKQLGLSVVHYSRQYNASTGLEATSYSEGGGPVPLLRPLFHDTQPAPPVNLQFANTADLTFLEATDALIDTPSMELFFSLLAAFPQARVVITAREPLAWAASRSARHPSDRAPLFHLLGLHAPMSALTIDQAAMSLALWQRVVAGSIAAERLLVLDVFHMSSDELWRRLSDFLQRPLPLSSEGKLPPFPKMGYGEDVWL